jgi:hypothetical protein
MMAVGSLAVFQQDGKERFDSLQHYSQTLPELQNSLKSEEDLASDGAFLTHFLMLVYEVGALTFAKSSGINFGRLPLLTSNIRTSGLITFQHS